MDVFGKAMFFVCMTVAAILIALAFLLLSARATASPTIQLPTI